jgi:hypothetical protein
VGKTVIWDPAQQATDETAMQLPGRELLLCLPLKKPDSRQLRCIKVMNVKQMRRYLESTVDSQPPFSTVSDIEQ